MQSIRRRRELCHKEVNESVASRLWRGVVENLIHQRYVFCLWKVGEETNLTTASGPSGPPVMVVVTRIVGALSY